VAARRPALPATFHRDLAAAIATGYADEADRAMRHHIRYGLDIVVRSLSDGKAGEIQRVK
jgi:DNA-binding FadR family transcriptional regulator